MKVHTSELRHPDYLAGLSDGRYGGHYGSGIDIPNDHYREGYKQGQKDREEAPERFTTTWVIDS